MYTPPFCWGGWTLNQIFEKAGGVGGLTKPQLLEGVAGKEGVTFFRGGCNFYIKNKVKSEMFNDRKKFMNKNIFLYHN